MHTEVIVVLDRSGSMISAKSDHEGGLKSFVDGQKQFDNTRFTLVQFDGENPFELIYDGVNIKDVGDIQLLPRGCTPLIEAVTRTIVHVQERLKEPVQVVFLIITDGEENASGIEYTNSRLKTLIKECESKSWVFMYLGANVDEFAEAVKMGFSVNTSAGYTANSECVSYMYQNISDKVVIGTRCAQNNCNVADLYNFSSSERENLKNGSISCSSDSKSN